MEICETDKGLLQYDQSTDKWKTTTVIDGVTLSNRINSIRHISREQPVSSDPHCEWIGSLWIYPCGINNRIIRGKIKCNSNSN